MRKPIDFMESATRRVRFEPPADVTDRMIYQFNNGQPVDGGQDVPKVGSIWQTSTTPSQGLDAATVERCAQVAETEAAAREALRDRSRPGTMLDEMLFEQAHMLKKTAANIRALATTGALDSAMVGRWVPQIGQRVRVTDASEFAGDWAHTDLWVAGVRIHDTGDGFDVTTSEQWPVPWRHGTGYLGHTDGWRVGATSCRDHLEPLATDPHQHGGKGA